MPTYHYKARDHKGQSVDGVLSADDELTVARMLKSRGLIPVTITPAVLPTKEQSSQTKTRTRDAQINGSAQQRAFSLDPYAWGLLKRVKPEELNNFTRMLYVLQKAGLPLLESLRSLLDQTSNPRFKAVIHRIIDDVSAGHPLSHAMRAFPDVFSPLYVQMIHAGEVSGKLVEILDRLAAIGEHEEYVRRQIKAATRYPLIVVFAITVAFVVLILFVLPRFAQIYGAFNTQLPLPTRILLFIHKCFTTYWWAMLSLGIAAGVGFRWMTIQPWGRRAWDGFVLKLPIFGPLILKLILSRFCRIMSVMMKSGVPILQILDLMRGIVGNTRVQEAVVMIRDSVNEGRGMSEPMRESGLFPPIVLQMVASGEKTGSLDDLLAFVSEYYDREIDYTIKNLVSLIEPILIFVLGLGILVMALGIFMPMWSLIKVFKPH